MVTLFQNSADCCGCGACAAACPQSAIGMVPGAMGQLLPEIRQDACIGCKKCLQVCSFRKLSGAEPLEAYGAAGGCRELVDNSASGGVFASLAKSCIAQGGIAAGAVMEWNREGARVCHKLSDDLADLPAMQGSKYIQSRAYESYPQVIAALKAGKTVLFSGTPCQIGAVKQLTGNPDNLITLDLICHGVPSEQLFNGFLKVLEKRLKGKPQGFCFRDKGSPKSFTARIHLPGKVYRLRSQQLSYYKYFLEADTYRESCYSCPYANIRRVSDLTMGDYWGIEKHHPEDTLPRQKHWSCLLVNTEKGKAFLKKHKEALHLFSTEKGWIAETNAQLRSPSKPGENREQICKAYEKGGYPAVERLFVKQQGGSLRFALRMHKILKRQE